MRACDHILYARDADYLAVMTHWFTSSEVKKSGGRRMYLPQDSVTFMTNGRYVQVHGFGDELG